MKFSIGDPVFVISNKEEGRIIEFIGKDMACIQTEQATYHAYLSDLEHPYLRWFLDKKKQPLGTVKEIRQDKNYARVSSLPEGCYMGFMPQYEWDGLDDIVTKSRIYLFNETSRHIHLEYACYHKNRLVLSHSVELKPLEEFYLHDLSFEELSTTPEFRFSVSDKKDAQLTNDYTLSLKPKKLQEFLHHIRHENKPVFHLKIYEKLEPRPRKEVIVSWGAKPPELKTVGYFDIKTAKTKYEIDLHIEKLVKNPSQLGNAEKLSIQLKEFQQALELGMATHQRSIVFIHGVGSGKLKQEIHSILNQTKGVYKYVSDYDTRYGYGATEVFFRP